MKLCGNCSRLIRERTKEEISNTDEFHKLLDINDNEIATNTGETRIDIQGRPFNWRAISRAYREQQNYTCECCGFGGDDLLNNYDKRYIHTHHIDGYALLNTHRNNLKSLCVLCHCKEDEHHESNFEKPRLKLELDSFVTKYRDVLIRIKNPYINDYIIDETT
ncbi:hypothetical protein [Cellulophaga omnivescoria]|uniref:hypothetical protein n=1 Tax=Cellulophaga omnivescoria TaxID=1888890 RepID=UPI0022EFDF3B|nr:hypothetical protein [Cellulophaga omnivescoria]WBU87963.1 hypothetical protein PBN93_08760 [Cellulophaga omnivescoria]